MENLNDFKNDAPRSKSQEENDGVEEIHEMSVLPCLSHQFFPVDVGYDGNERRIQLLFSTRNRHYDRGAGSRAAPCRDIPIRAVEGASVGVPIPCADASVRPINCPSGAITRIGTDAPIGSVDGSTVLPTTPSRNTAVGPINGATRTVSVITTETAVRPIDGPGNLGMGNPDSGNEEGDIAE